MMRYADPRRCPDCLGPIGYDDLACPSCRLPLRGATAAELFRVLSVADTLLGQLRGSTALAGARAATLVTTAPGGPPAAGAPVMPPAARMPAAPVGGFAPYAGPAPVSRPHGLSAASVPKILLALGAACLLVAAVVFLAVTWSVMGVGGRTATLVGFTAVTGALAAWMARRDLRGAAEALSLVSLGLLTLDVLGARTAGWLGDPGTPGFLVLLGCVLAATGTGVALAARRTPVGALLAPELVGAAGVALVAAGVGTHDVVDTAVALPAATVLAAAGTWTLARLRLVLGAAVAGLAAGVAWLAQLGHAMDTVLVGDVTVSGLWARGEVVELLVSTALVSSVALLRRVPRAGRVAALAVGAAVLTLAVVLPALDEGTTAATVAGLAALAVAAVGSWLLPRPWALSAVLVQLIAGVGVLAALLSVLEVATERLTEVAAAGWAGSTGDRLPGALPADLPEPWLAPLALVALLVTGAALTRAARALDKVVAPVVDVRLGVGLLAVTVVAALACTTVPVWTLVVAPVVAGAAMLGWWLVRPGAVPLTFAAAFVGVSVAVGWYDEWLTVASLGVLLLAAGAVHLRAADVVVSAAAGLVVPIALAGSVWTWGVLVEGQRPWVALTGLLLLSALVLTLHLYPAGWWSCADAPSARNGVEAGAAGVAIPLGLVGALTAPADLEATWASVYLTVAGAAVVALSLLRPDRRAAAWPGGVLLMLATWVRLADLGVDEPEAYTLPAALALLAVGLWRLRRDPDADTQTALGPGLALALLPSLVWTLDEPMTLRGLLLGLACLALVLVGVRTRWSAPLVLGAAVGAALVVRMAAPYVEDAVPRWVLIGAAGALLIAMGVTWERRLQEARHMMGYVRALR